MQLFKNCKWFLKLFKDKNSKTAMTDNNLKNKNCADCKSLDFFWRKQILVITVHVIKLFSKYFSEIWQTKIFKIIV